MKKIITLFFIVLFLVSVVNQLSAQTCNLSAKECASLQKEYDALQAEIASLQKELDGLLLKKNTLQGDVSILNAQIAKAQSEIKQRNITVTNLTSEINKKVANINSLEKRIADNKDLLANLLKKKDQNEIQPIFYLLLSASDLADMITDVDEVGMINQGLQDLFAELSSVKDETQKAKEDLDIKKNKELDAKYEIEQKKKTIDQNQAEKKQLLDLTTKVQSNYQTVLTDRQRQATEIRNRLFNLRDTQGISFSQALEYANLASIKTGVRPALILAIMSQESDLGKNLGSCTIYDLTSGKSKGVNTGRIFNQGIHPTRDLPTLQSILKELGRDPFSTRISCPLITELAGGQYTETGYGGAMGPSQFIPSTWKLYIPLLKSVLGVYPNPWNPEHSIMATALLLKDNGAAGGTYTSERNAACKYYSGAICTPGRRPANTFYGDQVIAKAEKFQNEINFLKDF